MENILYLKIGKALRKEVYLVIGLLIFSVLFWGCSNDKEESAKVPKYIFYFIGDGMGYSHISLAEAYLANVEGDIGARQLAMTKFPVYGMVNTFSANRQITGSAAAGTALATGYKENIDNVGFFDGKFKDKETILQTAQNKGYKTGLISSVSIDHATPAAFYANSPCRSNYYDIAKQLVGSEINFLGGGGLRNNMGEDNLEPDVFNLLIEDGYEILNNIDELNKENEKTFLVNPVILPSADMPYAIDRAELGGYSLENIVNAGIEFLFDDNGFLMVVEGGKIDWAAHENDAGALIYDIIDFDNSVKMAYEFYKNYPDQTLIIVTSDHETGGLALGIDENRYHSEFGVFSQQRISQSYLANKLEEFYNNGSLDFSALIEFLDNKFFNEDFSLTPKERARINSAYIHTKNPSTISDSELYTLYKGYCPVAYTCSDIINRRAAVGFTTGYHTAAAVPVFSIGVGSERFAGYLDNTEIALILRQILDE